MKTLVGNLDKLFSPDFKTKQARTEYLTRDKKSMKHLWTCYY